MIFLYFLCVSVCLYVCPVLGQVTRTIPLKKYWFEETCIGTYGSPIVDYYRVRDKAACGIKCTQTDTCKSFIYYVIGSWCSLNADVFVNRSDVGCSYLVDYAEVTVISFIVCHSYNHCSFELI